MSAVYSCYLNIMWHNLYEIKYTICIVTKKQIYHGYEKASIFKQSLNVDILMYIKC